MSRTDSIEHQNIGDALQSSPFNFASVMHMAMDTGGGGRGVTTGGGMGAAYDQVKGQASLDRGMQNNIYAQTV